MSHPSYRRQILCPRPSLLIALICWLCERLGSTGGSGRHAQSRATRAATTRRLAANACGPA